MEKDLIVIGGGPGGYVAAVRAAQLGMDVVLVEKQRLGGTCLNRGCIPTKAFYRNAQMIHDMARAEEFGIGLQGITLDIGKMLQRKQQVVDRLVGGIQQLMKAHRVEVVQGAGRLVDKNEVEVREEGGNHFRIKGKKILIASGSVPAKPPIPGSHLPGVVTSDEILEFSHIPEKLVIIGGGVIGIEFAGIFNALGSRVTVLEFMPQILPNLDGDLAKRLALSLKKRGIGIETEARVTEIFQSDEGLTVTAEGKKGKLQFPANQVLVSTGRTAQVEGLNLDAAGIQYHQKGILVDETFQTSLPDVYAVGDVIGGPMLAHIASEEGKAAVENMRGLKGHVSYSAVPQCVFTFPEVASVGISEEEAKKRGMEYRASKFMFGANGKALTLGEEEGFIKVLADGTGKIVGTHIMGPHASDLIHEAVLAMEKGLTVSDIGNTIHAHPTLSEAFAEAVLGIENRAVHIAPGKPGK